MENKNKKSKQLPRTVWLTEEQIRDIKRISERMRVPQAVLVREAVDWVIKKYNK